MSVELNTVVQEVIIDDSKALAGSARVVGAMENMAVAADKATDANKRQASGFSQLDAALQRSSPAQESALRRLNAWKAQADPVEASLQRLSRAETDLNRAISQGAASEQDKIRILDQLWNKLLGAAEAQEKLNAATRAQAAQGAFNSQLGVRDDFGAKDRAADIEAYGRELDQLQAKFDPVFRAQQMVTQETEALTRAHQAGAISQETYATEMARIQANATGVQQAIERYTAEVQQAKVALDAGSISQTQFVSMLTAAESQLAVAAGSMSRFAAQSTRGQNSSRQMGVAIQQAGYQVGDFAVQVASGQSPLRAFIQQGTQFVSMFGPWGAAIGAAGAVLGAVATTFFDLGDNAKGAGKKGSDALSDIADQAKRTKQELEGIASYYDRIALARARMDQVSAGTGVVAARARLDALEPGQDTRAAQRALIEAQDAEQRAYMAERGIMSKLSNEKDDILAKIQSEIDKTEKLTQAMGVSRHEYDVTNETMKILADSGYTGTEKAARAWAERLVSAREAAEKARKATDSLTGSAKSNTDEIGKRAKSVGDDIASMSLQAALQMKVAAAYGISTEAGKEAELEQKAAIATVGLGNKVYAEYLAKLRGIEASQKAVASAQALLSEKQATAIARQKALNAQITDPNLRHEADLALERQAKLNDLIATYGDNMVEINKHMDEFTSKQRYEEQARYWDDVRQKAEDVSNDISQFLIDGFVNAQEGGRSMFKNLWDGALQGAKRLVANIAAEFLKARIIMPVVTTIVGANAGMFGIAQAAGVGGGTGGAGGMMSLGGVGNSLLGLLDGGLFSQSLYGAGSWFGTSAVGQALGLSTLTGGVRGAASMPTLTGLGTSFSNALGNLGYGAIGGLAANLFGLGNSNPWVNMGASTIGSIGGSMLGGSLSILGSLGGPLGAIAGGFLGSALGGLFGNSKPSDMFAQTGIDLKTGTLGNTITGRPDETSQQNMDASKALAEQFLALQQQIMALTGGTGPEAAYAKVGSRDGIVVGVGSAGISVNNRQGSNSATFANSEEGAQKALDFMVQALAKQISGVSNPDIQTVLNRGGPAQEMLDNLTMVKAILDATAEAADPLTTALKAVDDNFDDLDKKARDLGLSTDLLTKLEAVRQKQLDEITAGASLGTYQNVQGALSQLTDWMTQQQLSDVSSLNPLGRQSLAQSTFDDLLKAVNDNGDLTKVGALTSSASNLLSIARQNYGSTAGFTSVESQVQQALSNLGLSISSQESIGDQVSRAIALSTQTNTEKLDELKAEIVKMRLAFSLMSQKLAA